MGESQSSNRMQVYPAEYSNQTQDVKRNCCDFWLFVRIRNHLKKIFQIPNKDIEQNLNQQQSIEMSIKNLQEDSQKSYGKMNFYCINQLDHCDCIKVNILENKGDNNIEYFVLSRFTIYFGQFSIETSQMEGNGWILQTSFDKNFNSSYFHYEGRFLHHQIVGSGQLFQQKSRIIREQGEWSSISKTLRIQPQIAIKPYKKLLIYEENQLKGTSDILKRPQKKFNSNESIAFHDQLLLLKDITILKQSSWLNSSIIDAYVGHLNYNDEVQYWTLIKEDRKLHKRLQIIPSWLFSWFHQGQDDLNLNYFKEIYSQFEPIQYRIWEIYKKIGVVVNSNNVHWYFVQLDFETMEMIIKDSMRDQQSKYRRTIDILQKLFQQIDKNISFTVKVCEECQQQRNGYDCGAYTCINAKELAEVKQQTINNGREMRNLLINLFLQTN